MVITSEANRHAARPAPLPADGADDGTATGEEGAPDGFGVVALGTVALGAVATGADVGVAGGPVVAVGCPPAAGWLGSGKRRPPAPTTRPPPPRLAARLSGT